MARDVGAKVDDLIKDPGLRDRINLDRYVNETIGLPTLKDIMAELAKPGRDPRQQFEVFRFAEGVEKPSDLKPGMKLPGIVTNVTAFGAFVDVGVHQDGLVHISQLSDSFVKDPNQVVKVGQKVQVTVVELDLARKRLSLSMKARPDFAPKSQRPAGDKSRQPPRNAPPRSQGGAGFGNNPFASALDKLDNP
jgi:uncharacterized protein